MVKIIPMGSACRVTWDMIKLNLKAETSLFEWVRSDTLGEVNCILEKLINNVPIEIYRCNGHDVLVDTLIRSLHYLNKDFSTILARRSARLLNDIRQNKELLFIRDDQYGTIEYEEIAQFCQLIETIHPTLNFKILVLTKEPMFRPIVHPRLYYRKYDVSLYTQYINECFPIEHTENSNIDDISDNEKG